MPLDFGAVGAALTQGIATLLGLSKNVRLRHDMNHHIDLYQRLIGHADLEQALNFMVEAIETEARQLRDRVRGAASRRYQWASFTMSVIVAAIILLVLYLTLPFPPVRIWHWFLWVPLGAFAVLFVIAGIMTIRKPSRDVQGE